MFLLVYDGIINVLPQSSKCTNWENYVYSEKITNGKSGGNDLIVVGPFIAGNL